MTPAAPTAAAATVDVVVIGGGHCGLAMSHALSQRGIEHVVLERGEVGHAWRTQRWDSLRLLTPNWMTQLPGQGYDGDDPDGYMDAPGVAAFLSAYARRIAAPVQAGTTVLRVSADGSGYRVRTDRGDWRCRALVLASGAARRPVVPAFAAALRAGIAQLTATTYRRPTQLDPAGVLVVGASATGVQLAQEIHRSGRPVTLAVGEHVRMPRLYRGRDIHWWMQASGVLDERIDEIDDPVRARRLPSPQLVGTPERATLDLNALREQGVRIVGRLAGVRDGRALFSGSLRNVCALADLKMNRLLDRFDAWARQQGDADVLASGPRPAATMVDPTPVLDLALQPAIRTVIWATGMSPDHSWLDLPVFDRRGELKHAGGVVTDAPGVYALGLPFMRRRKSSLIHGAGNDVDELVVDLAAHLDRTTRRRPAPLRTRPAVVLLHSSGSSSRQWRALECALQPHFEVHAVDLHDHGRQRAWTSDAALTLADEAGLAAGCLAHDEVHVVGHSYGAVVAMQLALLVPQRVRSLVAYEPVLMSWLIDEPEIHPASRGLLATAAVVRAGLLGGRPREAARHFVDYWSGTGQWHSLPEAQQAAMASRMPAIARHFDALAAQRLNPERLADVRSLWLCGGATVEATQRIADLLRRALPGACHETLPGLGHMGPLTHADTVNERVLRFLRASARPAPACAAVGAGAPARQATLAGASSLP